MYILDYLVYVEIYEWVKFEDDGMLIIGIIVFGQEQLGLLVYVDMLVVGKVLVKGVELGIVEFNKMVLDLYVFVDGEVIVINELLVELFDVINGVLYE